MDTDNVFIVVSLIWIMKIKGARIDSWGTLCVFVPQFR
jgi:drug/metabolite transporter superfamily protein YnfA